MKDTLCKEGYKKKKRKKNADSGKANRTKII